VSRGRITLRITVTRVNLKIASPHYYMGQAQPELSGSRLACDGFSIDFKR